MIVVTGASGYVGRSLAEWLADRGHRVGIHCRSADRWSFDPAVTVIGDLTRDDVASAVVDAADVVIHCAARVRGGTRAQFWRDNVEATQNLRTAKRLIHLSTVAVYGHQTQDMATESAAVDPHDDYAASKAASEHAAGDDAIVLRLGPVWGGPYDDRFGGAIMKALSMKVIVFPGRCATPLPLLHMSNLARAIEAALDAPVKGQCFNLTDGRPISLVEFVGALAASSNRRYSAVHMPQSMAKMGALMGGEALRRLNRTTALRPEIVELMNTSVTFDLSAAHDQLGYRPKHLNSL